MGWKRMTGAGAAAVLVAMGGPAWACGGLVGDNGAVNLGRTTTLAAYTDGIEHYITGFSFAGAGGAFGSIVPLPGIPTKVEKAGDWTLQRLQQEVQPPVSDGLFSLGSAETQAASPEVILETTVDSLDITVLKGGADAVGVWAKDEGFLLPPDTPEVLDFYARRSPIFMAVRFDAARASAQGLQQGQATPVHVTIPTDNPWVPLRILALGRLPEEPIQADVFLLTERRPAFLPQTAGLTIERTTPAGSLLLEDLRSDARMGWLPGDGMWFSYLQLDTSAGELTYDLAVDASGADDPSEIDAGLATAEIHVPAMPVGWAAALITALAALAVVGERRANAWR